MYSLLSTYCDWYGDKFVSLVARFSTKQKAEEYVKSCRLSSGKFRKDSPLYLCSAEIEKEDEVPIDPPPISTPPRTEYLVRCVETDFKILCGNKKESAERELKLMSRGSDQTWIIEERQI